MGDITPEFIAAVSQHTGVPAEFLRHRGLERGRTPHEVEGRERSTAADRRCTGVYTERTDHGGGLRS